MMKQKQQLTKPPKVNAIENNAKLIAAAKSISVSLELSNVKTVVASVVTVSVFVDPASVVW